MPHLLPAAASAIAQAAPAAAAAAAKATVMGTLKSVAFNALTSLAISSALSVFSPTVGASARQVEFVIDPDGPIPFAAGRVGVSGSVVHRDTFGPDLMYYGIPFVLSGAGPITAIESFMADDYPMAFDANGGAVTEPYRQELFFRSVLGFQPAPVALSTPGGLKKGATLPGWTGAHKLSGKAAGLIVMAENSKGSAFPTGEIKPLIQLLGLKGWDPTLDSTYPGGDGPCRLNDASTWVTLTCPILWGLKWALGLWEGPSLKGAPAHDSLTDHQVGGIGVRLSGVDVPAFVSASNIAKANGWTVSAYPNTDDDKHQVLETFLQSGGATYAQRAGKISCISRAAPRASLVTISARDTAGPLEIDTAASRIDRINTLRPRFWSPAHRWQMTAMTGEVTAQAYRDEDGGRTRSRGIDFPFVSDARQTGQLAALQIANTREGIAGVVPLKPHLQRIRPGDAFTITEPGFVLDGLKCLCLNTDYNAATGVVRVSFVSETDGKYPFALGQNPTPPSPQVLTPVDPRFVTPPDAGDWTVTPRPPSQGGAQQPGFDLTGFVSNATATAIIVETGPTDDGPWTQAYQGPPTVTNIPIDGLQPGATYFIAIQYQRNQNYSAREVFGPFTAPDLVAGDLSPESPVWTEIELQGVAIGEVTGRLQTVEGISAANAASVADLEEVYGDTVSSAQSALAAGEAANLAALKAQQADGSASASNVSAGVASTKADEASASASAANASQIAAESAKDGASGAATAAATSASNASTSATDAGQSATAASGSATQAGTSAGQAQTFASQASTSAGNANTAAISAGVSATTARQAVGQTVPNAPGVSPGGFATNQWTVQNYSGTHDNLQNKLTIEPQYYSVVAGALRVTNLDVVHLHTTQATARPSGHKVRCSTTFRRVVDGGDASNNRVTLYVFGWDASGAVVTTVEITSALNPTVSQGVQTLSFDLGDDVLGANCVSLRTMTRVWTTVGATEVLTIDTLDIQSETMAVNAAAAALASQANAAADASRASISANLAASVGANASTVSNGRFLNWPAGQDRPTSWDDWANANGTPNLQSGSGWNGRRFVRMNYLAGMNDMGMKQVISGFRGAGAYNLEVEVAIPFGGPTGTGFQGAGVLIQCMDANFNFLGDGGVLRFFQDPDTGGNVAGSGSGDGKVYRFSKRVDLLPNTASVQLYLMTRWKDGFLPQGANENKTLDWYSCDLSPVSEGDRAVPALSAQLNVTAAVAADAQTRLANVIFEVIGASGGDPFQLLFKTVGSSSLGQMVASALRFGNVIGGQIVDVMKLIGGSVFITGKLLLGAAGQIELDPAYPLILWKFGSARLAIGQLPSNNLFLWFGGNETVPNMRKNNAKVWFDTTGNSYWGGSILAGTISNSVQGSNSLTGISATLGPFATNGGPITIAWSYDFTRTGSRYGDQTGTISGSTAATVRLYRRIGAAAETLIDTMVVSGSMSAQYDGEPIPGQPSGTTGQTFFQEYMGQSRTYSDTAGGTATRTYRIAVESRSLKNISGSSNGADGINQRYGVTSSE